MPTSSLVIRHCRFLPGDGKGIGNGDIRIDIAEDGGILAIGTATTIDDAVVIDAEGCYLMPAFTDIGYTAPDTGFPGRDTALTAAAAATAGGYRRLLALPLAGPSKDPRICTARSLTDPETVALQKAQIYTESKASFDLAFRREVFLACAKSGSLYVSSGVEPSLCVGAVSAGLAARFSGVKGIPFSAETIAVARDLLLAEETGCRLHLLAVASETSVTMIREAKKRGVRVTCGVSPFHLSMTDEDIAFYGAMSKLLPPLRTRRDREALREALFDGTIDCVSSLHTPLTKAEKNLPLAEAAFGLTSIETTLSVLLTYLPELLRESPQRMAEVMAITPAALLAEDCRLMVGNPADFVLVCPSTELVVSENTLKSKSVNTPFLGQTLTGRVNALYLGGKRV